MPLVAAEQFVRSLADQGYFDILPRALRDKIHRDDGRSRNRFFQTFHDLWKRSFKFGLVKLHRHMPSAQKGGCLRCIGQLVIFEALSVADGVCRPRAALLIHQRQEQARVKAAAEKDSDRHVAEQMTLNRASVQLEQFAGGFFIFLRSRKRSRACSYTSVLRGISLSQQPASCPAPVFEYLEISLTEKAYSGNRRNRLSATGSTSGLRVFRGQNGADFRSESQACHWRSGNR